MKNMYRLQPRQLFFTLVLVCFGCSRPQPVTTDNTCDCTIYPFAAKCDSKCGITDGVVESVSKDSVTVKMPPGEGHAAELRTIPLADLKLDPAALKAGTSVSLTYKKSTTEPLTIKPNAIKSLVLSKVNVKAH